MQSAKHNASDRIRLFRLAWDVTSSSFGARQVLYERFFFGDPVRVAGGLYMSYDKQPAINYVNTLLDQGLADTEEGEENNTLRGGDHLTASTLTKNTQSTNNS
jgi:aromatic ring hydroxylase